MIYNANINNGNEVRILIFLTFQVMFNPSPNDPLVQEEGGIDGYQIVSPIELVVNITILKDFIRFKFKDFKSAQKFANKVGKISERENHHPDIQLGWGYVNKTTYTHAIKGLSINDFILAAKINKI